MRVLRGTIRLFGWLMTPFVVWGASVLGAWVGAGIGRLVPSASAALALSITLSIGWGVIALIWWVHSLNRARKHSRDRRLAKKSGGSATGDAGGVPEPPTAEAGDSTQPELKLEYDEAVA